MALSRHSHPLIISYSSRKGDHHHRLLQSKYLDSSSSVPMSSHSISTAQSVQVLALNESSQRQQDEQRKALLQLKAQNLARTVSVPTLPAQVRDTLRSMGLPVRLFGENLANVRERLQFEIAKAQVAKEEGLSVDALQPTAPSGKPQQEQPEQPEEEQVTKYTRAEPELIKARQAIAAFSVQRSFERLERERVWRHHAKQEQRERKRQKLLVLNNDDAIEDSKPKAISNENDQSTTNIQSLSSVNEICRKTYKMVRQVALEGSQYGDSRALSSLASTTLSWNTNHKFQLVVTGSWTSNLHLWKGGGDSLATLSSNLTVDDDAVLPCLGRHTQCHEDRIMGVAVQASHVTAADSSLAMIASASLDKTAKLWKVHVAEETSNNDDSMDTDQPTEEASSMLTITEAHHLVGHEARLCRTAFHPLKQHVATTSFDHTWRFWDVTTGQSLLLQDGHARECYGVGFHPDGSLIATSDLAGVVHVWDLRTGKSIEHYMGHAGRVLSTEFHPVNGFQLATAGDDGTIQIWDLRRRRRQKSASTSIPAHNNLITQLSFDPTGEYLSSSSFDGTVKLWSCRKWNMLNQIEGHQGKVTCVDVLDDGKGIVTCGFDKTLKLWR